MSPEEIDRMVTDLSFMLEFSDSTKLRIQHAVRQVSDLVSIPFAQLLFAEGEDRLNDGYVLLSGAVSVTSSDGFTKTVHAPALLGEMKQFAFEDSERTATVTAMEDSLALRFAWDRLYAAAAERLSPEEQATFRKGVEMYAWMHYLEHDVDSF